MDLSKVFLAYSREKRPTRGETKQIKKLEYVRR
jgi:hypothetical protein